MSSSTNIPATPAHGYELGTNSSRHRDAATRSHAASLATPRHPPTSPKTKHELNLPMWHFAAPTRASQARAAATKASMESKLHMTTTGGVIPPASPPNNKNSHRASFGSPGSHNGLDFGFNKTPSRKVPAKPKPQLLRTPIMKLPDANSHRGHDSNGGGGDEGLAGNGGDGVAV